MNIAERNELLDAYYRSLEETNFDAMEEVFAESVTFTTFMAPEGMEGRDTVLEYLHGTGTDVRPVRDPTITIYNRHHAEDVSAVEGKFELESLDDDTLEGGDVVGEFCGVFTFDEDENEIVDVSVYYRQL